LLLLRLTRVVVVEILLTGLVHELALHLLLHARHHWVLLILHLRLHHYGGLHIRALHHHRLAWHHLGRRCEVHEDGAAVVRVLHLRNQDLHVQLAKTALLNEVLNSENVHAHLLGLLKELLFDLFEVEWDILSAQDGSHRHLVFNHSALLLTTRQWWNLTPTHVVDELSWQFIKRFLRQKSRVMLEIIKGDKLHDICRCIALSLG